MSFTIFRCTIEKAKRKICSERLKWRSKRIERKGSKKREDNFIRNGGKLLEESISFSAEKCNPIRSFSAEELKKATQNYNSQLQLDDTGDYVLYKGLLRDRLVMVKKYLSPTYGDPFKDAIFSSVFSVQKNVVKLLGCCLEMEFPILVFEYAENGTLQDRLFNSKYVDQPLPWKSRLKIAVELCNAVAYLHNAFPKPIIHRDIYTGNIFLDENNAAKLSDFSLSIAIPDDEFQIEDESIFLTSVYLAPECIETFCFDEKIDVYAVGVVLLKLLTRKRMFDMEIDRKYEHRLEILVEENLEKHKMNEVVDTEILKEGQWPGKEKQLEDFARIALQCLRRVEERPTIIEVVKQLSEIYRSLASPVAL